MHIWDNQDASEALLFIAPLFCKVTTKYLENSFEYKFKNKNIFGFYKNKIQVSQSRKI